MVDIVIYFQILICVSHVRIPNYVRPGFLLSRPGKGDWLLAIAAPQAVQAFPRSPPSKKLENRGVFVLTYVLGN